MNQQNEAMLVLKHKLLLCCCSKWPTGPPVVLLECWKRKPRNWSDPSSRTQGSVPKKRLTSRMRGAGAAALAVLVLALALPRAAAWTSRRVSQLP
ncbi:hypothetical protein PybrP1_004910 [[Pythium] brassicae (nom. inval.)]|nr:hypothetical protein PybrP1_004910 [[Pythium] brassicae (nom. inval.)]